jgi:phosphoenolpyruvate-protein phosphotransferase (PTS system enzyme I)
MAEVTDRDAERELPGIGATPLAGVGTVVWYRPNAGLELPTPEDEIDPETEQERFEDARERASADLETERDRLAERVGESEAEVFDAHLQFLSDPQIESGVTERIDSGTDAEHAVSGAFEDPIAQFEGMDGRMGERADDLRDVRDRLLRAIMGRERTDLSTLPDGAVVLAERLTPSDTAQLDPERVRGFATVAGGRTSHAAIFARSLSLPAVVGVGDELTAIEADTQVAIDGEDERVIVAPSTDTRERLAERERAPIRTDPVATADGRAIEVAANVGGRAEIEGAVEQGADGIGLYRTEFLFLDRESPPDETEQYEAYLEALDAFPDGRVVVRTLDIGGDKRIPYLDLPDEENPFLGERGIRRSLAPDAALFETQLRALCRAGAEGRGELCVMLPLVASIEEFEAAEEVLDAVCADLNEGDTPYIRPSFGVMIETPAAALLAPELAARADFLSIGTNDLTQYVMAADRGNERVAELHDPQYPAVLRAIARTVSGTDGTDTWVGMCGEMAGDPDLTALLVGLGLDELSMSAVTIPAVKAGVVDTHTEDAENLAERALETGTKAQVGALLTEGDTT